MTSKEWLESHTFEDLAKTPIGKEILRYFAENPVFGITGFEPEITRIKGIEAEISARIKEGSISPEEVEGLNAWEADELLSKIEAKAQAERWK